MSDTTKHCVICQDTYVELDSHPYRVNGKMVGVFYCCPFCKGELAKIKVTKEK